MRLDLSLIISSFFVLSILFVISSCITNRDLEYIRSSKDSKGEKRTAKKRMEVDGVLHQAVYVFSIRLDCNKCNYYCVFNLK